VINEYVDIRTARWYSDGESSYMREFYLHSRVATLTISIPPCVYSHTQLSFRVGSYTNSKILRDMYEKFQKHPYFLNIS
jgi:hypothetical protein